MRNYIGCRTYLALDDGLLGTDEVLVSILLQLCFLDFLDDLVELHVLSDERRILDFDLFFELIDLMSHSCVLLGQLSNFLLALQKVLAVEISVRPDGLVEVLLMFEFGLELLVLLLELMDDVVLDLDLFYGLVVPGMGLGGVDTVLLLLLLQEIDDLVELGCLDLVATDLVLKFLLLVLGIVDRFLLFELSELLLLDLLAIGLSLPPHVLHLLLGIVDDLLLFVVLLRRVVVLLLKVVLPLLQPLTFLNGLILLHSNDLLLFELLLDDFGKLLVGLHLLVELDLLVIDLLLNGVDGLLLPLNFLLVPFLLFEDSMSLLVHLLSGLLLLFELLLELFVGELSVLNFLLAFSEKRGAGLGVLLDLFHFLLDFFLTDSLLLHFEFDVFNRLVVLVDQLLILLVDFVMLFQEISEFDVLFLDLFDLELPVILLLFEFLLLLDFREFLVLTLLNDLIDLRLLIGIEVGDILLQLDQLLLELDVLLPESGGLFQLLLDLSLELLGLLFFLLTEALGCSNPGMGHENFVIVLFASILGKLVRDR